MVVTRRSYGYQPVDLIAMGYAAFVVVVLLLGPRPITYRSTWLAGASAFLLLVFLLRFLPPDLPRFVRFFRATHLLFALPAGYASAGAVGRVLHQGYFDDVVLRWEVALFGGHPHVELAARLPFAPLSEFLHFCYYIYLWLVPILCVSLALARRERQLQAAVTVLAATYYACFAFFIAFPVLGPYYTFARVEAPGDVFVPLVHRVLDGGAARGTAFPSSHCAIAAVVVVSAWRYSWRPLATLLTVIGAGIIVATMYGGFHYTIDSIVGVLVGSAFAVAAPRLHATLGQWGGGARRELSQP